MVTSELVKRKLTRYSTARGASAVTPGYFHAFGYREMCVRVVIASCGFTVQISSHALRETLDADQR